MAGSNVAGSLEEAINRIAQGFSEIFKGNIGEAIGYLLEALPAIGVFYIIYRLMGYILKITIIRDDTHARARGGIALGMALIGIYTAYPVIVNLLGTFFTIIIVVIFVVYGLVIAIARMSAKSREAYADKHRAGAIEAQERSAERKVLHDETIDKRRLRKEKKDIRKAEKIVRQTHTKQHDSESIFNDIRLAISRISGLEGEGKSTEAYRKRILEKLSPLVSQLTADDSHLTRVEGELSDLKAQTIKGIKIEEDEAKTLETFKGVLTGLSGVHEDHLKEVDERLLKFVARAHKLDQVKRTFEQDIDDRLHNALMKLEQMKNEKHNLASALALPNNSSNIVTVFGRLESEFREVERQIDGVRPDIEKINEIIHELQVLENYRAKLVKDLKAHAAAHPIP